jgi:hypothetical protein
MTRTVPPRLYCIPATKAPVVAVFRRGPTDWSQVGRWDLVEQRYEPGAWLGGRLFPRRCDLSSDGRWLSYFAHQPSARWEHGEAYVAVSKLPWLTALHAFRTCGTWTRGYFFTDDGSGEASEVAKLPIPYGLHSIPALQFALERRRGWVEAPDSPPRDPRDTWDERRNARMHKRQPGGPRLLRVESLGWAGGEFGVEQAVDGLRVLYAMESDGEIELMHDLQWADWDAQGRLLVATRNGRLEVRTLGGDRVDIQPVADLSLLEPDPAPPPPWAGHW